MATRLTLYNGALRLLGQTNLEDTDEAREPRYALDDAYDKGAVKHCLEQGMWNFAMRSVEIDKDDSISPSFGLKYAYTKPTDWVRTAIVASDEYFSSPLTDLGLRDEAQYWYSDLTTMWVQYVSNDAAYGGDLSLWPQTFVQYVEAFLAAEICPRLGQSNEKYEQILKLTERRLLDARAMDGMNEGAKFMPAGSWTTARRGGHGRRDRGSRSSLTG